MQKQKGLALSQSKGFTIIELIVVVAIIAVLAAIVLVNVTGFINKGKNAAIKGNLSSIMTNAAVYFDTNGNYNTTTTFCDSTAVTAIKSAVTGTGGIHGVALDANNWQCRNNTGTSPDTAFCACAMLIPVGATGTVFCVDSTGTKIEKASASCNTICPSNAIGACVP